MSEQLTALDEMTPFADNVSKAKDLGAADASGLTR